MKKRMNMTVLLSTRKEKAIRITNEQDTAFGNLGIKHIHDNSKIGRIASLFRVPEGFGNGIRSAYTRRRPKGRQYPRRHLFTYVVAERRSDKRRGTSIYPLESSDLDGKTCVQFVFPAHVRRNFPNGEIRTFVFL